MIQKCYKKYLKKEYVEFEHALSFNANIEHGTYLRICKCSPKKSKELCEQNITKKYTMNVNK